MNEKMNKFKWRLDSDTKEWRIPTADDKRQFEYRFVHLLSWNGIVIASLWEEITGTWWGLIYEINSIEQDNYALGPFKTLRRAKTVIKAYAMIAQDE